MPSLLAGVATVPLVYVLGARTVGRAAGLAGAALLALSPFAIFYASEARAYALMTLIVVLSTLALLRALETNERRWWAAFALLQAAAMYSALHGGVRAGRPVRLGVRDAPGAARAAARVERRGGACCSRPGCR